MKTVCRINTKTSSPTLGCRQIAYGYFLSLIVILFGSCKNIETKKVSSEELFNQEIQQINWKEVESYPLFENCEEFSDKTTQYNCFEREFSTHIYNNLSTRQVFLTDSVHEKIWLYVSISKEGVPKIDSFATSEKLDNQLPKLRQWLDSAVVSLPNIHPATKRGVPVATTFKMPIQITVN